MNNHGPVRRFVTACRDFGLVIAMRVAYSKLRGKLRPALALPDPPVYQATNREVSVLLSTADQPAAAVVAIVEVLAGRGGSDWEVCICELSPVDPEMARGLSRFRGTQPWIRIVTTDASIDNGTATRWTIEQATGRFVALVAPGYTPAADVISSLLARLHNDSELDAAVLVAADDGSGSPPPWTDCRLLLQRKSGYLSALQGRWHLSAAALAKDLHQGGVPTAHLVALESAVNPRA